MYLEIFLADFAVFRVFWEFRGISRKYLNFAGPRPREISEALYIVCLNALTISSNTLTDCSCDLTILARLTFDFDLKEDCENHK